MSLLIRRLANHPSIALWCGNNENEEGLAWYDEVKANRDKYVQDYINLYLNTIQKTLKKEDPSRRFWPSSPSNGVDVWGHSNKSESGDAHYWGNYKLLIFRII